MSRALIFITRKRKQAGSNPNHGIRLYYVKNTVSPQPRFELGSKASEALILSIELPGQD